MKSPSLTFPASIVGGACFCLMLAACSPIRPGADRVPEDAAPRAVELKPFAVPNDNRQSAGELRDGIYELHLEARRVDWRPDNDPEFTYAVVAFAEKGGPAQIPGPFIRVPQGTEMRITVRNAVPESANIGLPPVRQRREGMRSVAGSELTVHGLRAGTVANDVLHVPVGEEREVRFRADKPGTFLYWGAMSRRPLQLRTGTDGQLTGAIVVDPAGSVPDPDERFFIITETDAFPDESRTPPGQDIFELTINGLSWPHTERLRYALGETVRWRWLNGSFSEHPMHLHGFHFRVTARGDSVSETVYPRHETQLAVTELMDPGNTFRMEWVPTREGNWLMHCHIVGHITPFPEREDGKRAYELFNLSEHPFEAMDMLVMGITITDTKPSAGDLRPRQQLWLTAREQQVDGSDAVIRGFVVSNNDRTPNDDLIVPGPPLILTRDETTSITVVNRMSEPTTVHWHAMELDSVYDGIPGWSRTGSRVAPLVGPGESFRVQMTPPRAGTFIYHTHMGETEQLIGGMYGPLLVMESGEVFNPETDRVFVIGGAVEGGEYREVTINGRREPAPATFRAGTRYRLRFINITPESTVDMTLARDGSPVSWLPLANDGADLPQFLRTERVATFRFGAGETYDFLWTPSVPGELDLILNWPFPTEPGERRLRQRIEVE